MLERNLHERLVERHAMHADRGQTGRHWSAAALALSVLAAITVVFLGLMAFVGITTWHWAEQNVLHVGLQNSSTTTVSQTELLKQVRAFELVTVKQTYATRTQQSIGQTFNAGASRRAMPSWLAGEQMDVQGQVQVTAGVDLAQVGAEDIQVSRAGNAVHVQIAVPDAHVIGTELVPNTLKVSTHAGVLTQLGQTLGMSDEHLRDRAADDLVQAGREAALQQGIQANAAREGQVRLQDFLQKLPQPGSHITYAVVVHQEGNERTRTPQGRGA